MFKLFQGFQGRMKPLLLHLLGQFGEGLEDGQTHGEALDCGGNVLLYSTSLHQVLTPRNDLRRRLVQFLGFKKIILFKVSLCICFKFSQALLEKKKRFSTLPKLTYGSCNWSLSICVIFCRCCYVI